MAARAWPAGRLRHEPGDSGKTAHGHASGSKAIMSLPKTLDDMVLAGMEMPL